MTLSFACPYCGKNYRNVKRKLIGKKARCSCGKVIRIGDSKLPVAHQDFDQLDLQPDVAEGKLASSKSKKNPIPTVAVQVNKNLVVDDHYSDLDELLAGNGHEDAEFVGPLGGEIEVPAGLIDPPVAARSSSISSLALLSAIASATIAFWFGLLVVMARFAEFDQILLTYFQQTFAGIISGSFGYEEVAPGFKLGFIVIGWSMWVIGLAMLVVAIGQLLNALIQLFLHRQLVRWADGLMATISIVFVFLVVGSLFLHASHMSGLNRELNKIVPVGTADEFVPPNVQRVREQYEQRNRTYLTVMLISGAIPLSVFAFSMVRLLASSDEPKLAKADAKRPIA
jgi:hypothetical protein